MPARGIVLVADGAGDYQAASKALCRVAGETNLPLAVEEFDWSHGYGRVIADQTDYDHARCQGQRLAARVCAYRKSCPDGEVYLVGYSAGSGVVLAAAEALPPASIDRIILLAPSVSACYDLRRALQTSRQGMDVFHSRRDTLQLGLGTDIVGTADRMNGPAAGRVGFAAQATTPEDAVLYRRLRQHAWDPAVAWTGNEGGHYGAYKPRFLAAYVVPLLRSCGS